MKYQILTLFYFINFSVILTLYFMLYFSRSFFCL